VNVDIPPAPGPAVSLGFHGPFHSLRATAAAVEAAAHRGANEGMRRGDYLTLGELVDDAVLETFAVVGDPRQVAEGLRRRYRPVDQVILSTPFQGAAAQESALEILALSRH
jgi:alkanesulfonate monooxygenase SsuD/methylene tetrahydromethanopterin reductase-like flavin-dependent oxidoreductase (luciferase family)